MCRHVCPVSNAERRETTTPGVKMASVDLVRLGALPLDEHAAELMHACTGCGACAEFCLLGNEPAITLVQAREAAAAADVSPIARDVKERMRRSGNPTGSDLVALHKERVPVRPERGDLVYFPGCTALRRLPEHARDTVAAVEQCVGHEIAVVPPSEHVGCCGYPLWAAGLTEEFRTNARRMVTHLGGRGTVVTSDAGCAWTITKLYAEAGIRAPLQVLHTSQVFAQGRISKTSAEHSLWHDPCHLGRHLGIYDEPRRALAQAEGAEPHEFVWNREKSECCGGGALYPRANPAGALEAAHRRVNNETDELMRTGATRVVTSCPTCEVQLGRAGVRVFDLSRAVLGTAEQAPRSEGKR